MENYFKNEKLRQSPKNSKIKIFIAASLIFLFLTWLIGLFETPSNFRPVRLASDANMSQYLTNYILPQLYNELQLNQPFNLSISQDGINDIIVRQIDVDTLKRANLSDFSVTFIKKMVLLTAKTKYSGFNFIMTLVLKPAIDKNGYFTLDNSQIYAGQSRIPYSSRAIKRKIVEGLTGFVNNLKINDFNQPLLDNKIEPVFSLNRQKHRIDKITVLDNELVIHFQPQ